MAYSYNAVGSKSAGDTIAVTFPFIDRSHVKVLVDGVEVSAGLWSWSSDSLVSCLAGFPSGTETRVQRFTPVSSLPSEQSGSGVFDYAGANLNDLSALYISQERNDREEEVSGNLEAVYTYTQDAAASKVAAAASASAASTSATNAGTSETNAAASKAAAAASASAAAGSASAAAGSASAASTSATNAATSETNATGSLVAFYDMFVGASSTDPTVDLNGDPVSQGQLYWNTTSQQMMVRGASSWNAAYLAASDAGLLTTGTLLDARLSFTVSAFAKTVLDDPDAATWRATVGAVSQADGDARWAKLAGAAFTGAVTMASTLAVTSTIYGQGPCHIGYMTADDALVYVGYNRTTTGQATLFLYADNTAPTSPSTTIARSAGTNAAFTITQTGTGGVNIVPGSGGLMRDGNSVRDVANTPNMSDAEVTAGTDTTPKVPTAAQLKLAVETWGAKGEAFAIVEDQKASGTGGGSSTAGSWVTRTLNTEVKDPLNRITLSSNTFVSTVNAEVEWSAPGYQVNSHKTRLYNVTDSVVVAYGTTERSPASGGIMTRSFGRGDIVAGKTYRIDHMCATTDANGFGYATYVGWPTESYTVVAFFGR